MQLIVVEPFGTEPEWLTFEEQLETADATDKERLTSKIHDLRIRHVFRNPAEVARSAAVAYHLGEEPPAVPEPARLLDEPLLSHTRIILAEQSERSRQQRLPMRLRTPVQADRPARWEPGEPVLRRILDMEGHAELRLESERVSSRGTLAFEVSFHFDAIQRGDRITLYNALGNTANRSTLRVRILNAERQPIAALPRDEEANTLPGPRLFQLLTPGDSCGNGIRWKLGEDGQVTLPPGRYFLQAAYTRRLLWPFSCQHCLSPLSAERWRAAQRWQDPTLDWDAFPSAEVPFEIVNGEENGRETP